MKTILMDMYMANKYYIIKMEKYYIDYYIIWVN